MTDPSRVACALAAQLVQQRLSIVNEMVGLERCAKKRPKIIISSMLLFRTKLPPTSIMGILQHATTV